MKSEQCSSSNPRNHWKCEQGGCECRCHVTVIYNWDGGGITEVARKHRTRKLSPRGNWLIITFHEGEIEFCTWVQTWAGVQASKRNAEASIKRYQESIKGFKGRVIVVDIERMIDFAVTEGANEIADLERLFKMGDQ
ncbi:MAG: hypothetical protein WBD45_16645 [Terriglobales bacterium]